MASSVVTVATPPNRLRHRQKVKDCIYLKAQSSSESVDTKEDPAKVSRQAHFKGVATYGSSTSKGNLKVRRYLVVKKSIVKSFKELHIFWRFRYSIKICSIFIE